MLCNDVMLREQVTVLEILIPCCVKDDNILEGVDDACCLYKVPSRGGQSEKAKQDYLLKSAVSSM